MPRRKLQPVEEEPLELEDFQDDEDYEEYEDEGEEENVWQRAPLWLRFSGTVIVIGIVLAASFEFVYAGKIYPGVSADGVDLSGLTKSDADQRISEKISTFQGSVVTIASGNTNTRIPVASLGVTYSSTKAADLAFQFGRTGGFFTKLHAQARALFGKVTNFSYYGYADDQLTSYLVDMDSDLTSAVQDASLSFDNNQAQVTPAQPGSRLDLGRLTQLINDRLSATSSEPITAPVYHLTPDLDTQPLQAVVNQINGFVSGPITVSYSGIDREIDQQTIISWIQVSAQPPKDFLSTQKLEDLFAPPPPPKLGLDPDAVTNYVNTLSKGIDQNAQNAQLSMDSTTNQLTVVQPARNGVKVDRESAVKDITAALSKSGDERHVDLQLSTTTAEVNETNLDQLGIKEQISEGETTFPGSSANRLINVRQGAKQFNNVLLKPGEQFSFGKILGDVGPETGYVPELVILANHEEKQYGGGLCQVASTAYRAALLAGLPINERHNHSFAVSFYTAPYGVPGVDATIYYPQVDLKFTNDTGHYILIQTIMDGTDLKFDFYGTKTKVGVIRGPTFVSGTTDTTKASHTVFYRDVQDLSGNVTHTDTIDTYYKPSTDFPVTKQYN
jgi:vancomycin resistance protein YoaR